MTPWVRSGILVAFAVIGFGLGVCLRAQAPQPPQIPQTSFRTNVNAVTLDVTVVDKKGLAVTDLTAADFEVTERGTAQTLQQFELVDMAARPPMSSNLYHEVRTMQSMAQEVARRDSRLIVVFLDDYHVPSPFKDPLYQAERQVRMQVADVVRDLDPRDLVAIMYPLTLTTSLSFSRDHVAQAKEIEKFEGRQGDYFQPKNQIEENMLRDGQPEKHRREAVWTALRGLCTFLGTLRESRKSVLYVSTWAPGGLGGFAFDEYRQIQQAAAKSNTAFYPFDPRGLLLGPSLTAHDWMRVLADTTGGRAIVNMNDGRQAMTSMVSDSSAYYLIGYSSTEDPRDGKFHPVKVKVKRPGVEVLAREGYWAFDADALARAAAPLPPPVAPEVNAALEAAEAPESGHAFRAWAGADRDAAGRAMVTVVWEAIGAEPIDSAEVTALSSATSYRGRAPRDADSSPATGVVSFPSPAGTVDVRVGARSADARTMDAVALKVTVPSVGALGMSTPRFIKGRISRDVLRPDARPTATREFRRDEQVVIRIHAWAATGPALHITAQLLSDHGELLIEIPANAVEGADGVFNITLPISSLGLGRYVAEITATDSAGATTKTLSAFRVR